MSIVKDGARQYPLYAEIAFTYEDLEKGVAVEAIDLPAGAEVVSGAVVIDVEFDDTPTLSVEDGESNEYLAANAVATAGERIPLVPVGARLVAPSAVTLTYDDATGATSQGAGRVKLEYVLPNRGHEVQPVSRSEYGSP